MIIYDRQETNYEQVVEPNPSRTQVRTKLSERKLKKMCPTHDQYKFREPIYLQVEHTDNEEITEISTL